MAEFLENIDKSWTLFLDRDGVINRKIVGDYVQSWGAFQLIPGVLESMSVFAKQFGRVIVVTNQQGIGKKMMDEAALNAIHNEMKKEIQQAGGRLDAIYYCPDLETKPNNCRKPGIAMALQARKDFPEIEFSKSIMVGDSASDMLFGITAGMYTVFVGYQAPKNFTSDLRLDNLFELASLIK